MPDVQAVVSKDPRSKFLPLKTRSVRNWIKMLVLLGFTLFIVLLTAYTFQPRVRTLQSEICKRNSKSFYFACQSFPRKIRSEIYTFYSFARAADDLIDEFYEVKTQQNNLSLLQHLVNEIAKDVPLAEKNDKLMQLITDSSDSFRPITKLDHDGEVDDYFDPLDLNNFSHIVLDFAALVDSHGVDEWVVQLLLDGLKHDTITKEVANIDDLLNYCIGVASSIGIFCCYIFKRTDMRTLQFAASLGIAMQLTNISRDILTDLAMDRTYVPNTWFKEAGISRKEFTELPMNQRQVYLNEYAIRLFNTAEKYYSAGWDGLSQLPRYAQGPVASALLIYRDIGFQVKKCILRTKRYPKRAYTSKTRKLSLYFRAKLAVLTGIKPHFEVGESSKDKTGELLQQYIESNGSSK